MDLCITCDANAESGVGEVIDEISGPTRRHFRTKDYGVGMTDMGVVLMCRNPKLNFERRIRFVRKAKTLYMDVMLDPDQMKQADHEARKKVVVQRLLEDIPVVLAKYSIDGFDDARFLSDLRGLLTD